MTTLTDFLLARIAEDEEMAATAAAATHGAYSARGVWEESSSGVLSTGAAGLDGLIPVGDSRVTRHAAQWDPARVLAECEAKRRIVERYAPTVRAIGGDEWVRFTEYLELLALPYADHPDFRPEWAA